MSNIPVDQKQQLPSDELDELGLGQGIVRNESETDAEFAERMIYELDVTVEELWSVQDKIRELVPVEPAA